ncbi:Longevity-assurance protein [Dictyocaulus viviparus]|uniref:Longevity-assurance protein n=1 Tax=Dictyocaulus viviparus TaxID=29172 RepID=A0A0D8XPH2_DICVI|nr:Longevity-assurance protein [Dictyocaulus viviparus]
MEDIWKADHWLPRGIEWHQLPNNFSDLLYPIYFSLPLIVFRIFLESFVGVPIGFLLGYYENESVVDAIFNHLNGGFARQTRSKRVLECFWRFSYYTFAFIYGIVVLWNKSWLWDVKQCWIEYPFHSIDDSVWWYYMIETSFYYSLLLASFFDVKRSDFWQLIVHHFITIGLLSTSFAINFVRVGTLVLISHDLGDILLEFTKLTRYDRKLKVLTNACFCVFLIIWIITRLIYYPFVVVQSALFDAASLIQPDYDLLDITEVGFVAIHCETTFKHKPYAPRVIIFMLFVLLILHIFWTALIMKVIVKAISQGEAGDVRSDSERSDIETHKLIEQNGQRSVLRRRTARKHSNSDDDSDSDCVSGNDRNLRKNGVQRRRLR